ncbi:SpoIIE family protein phosphatase [Actinotalea solisilvae]|uniref:SpoIIE family protein phosphatase n=1 Tax=Actinotalea solisilvae TaxID=2072922 RepID=UPI0018F1D0AF|nr:SpoIIE family protein phosphatase [Actinotalea solisilvae]
MPDDPRSHATRRRRDRPKDERRRSAERAVVDPSEVLTDLALAAAGIGTFEWDLVANRLHWDDRMHELFGYARGEFDGTLGAFNARLHPTDRPVVGRGVQRAIDTLGEFELEYRVEVPGGPTRWIVARGRALPGPDGSAVRVLGVGYDSTAQGDAEVRVTRVLESMPTAFFSLARDWRFTYVNAEAERLLERHRDELLGQDLWAAFPEAVGSPFEHAYREAMSTGSAVAFEAYYPAPLDRWYEVRAWPNPDGLSVYFLDVTARRGAQEAADAASRRLALTASVTHALSETLEAEEAVGRLARLLVPELGDWCVVTLVEDPSDGVSARRRLRDIASWHVDPEQRPLVERYASARLEALRDESFLGRALETNDVVNLPVDATAAVSAVLREGEAQDLLRALAPESAVVLPLRARGRTVGAVSLFSGPGRAPISPADLVNAREVAGRAGLALANARLYRQQRQLAEGFQRSLLTEPPEPDHVQVVVRYRPAAEAAKVGGDWYDAFLQPDGATVLVIGDVVGHDVAAAATMGQVRSILRGVAVTTGAGPARVLEDVDRALRTLQTDAIATAVVARIEQTDDERARGVTHIRFSNAGHPDPMVVNPDGTVATLSAVRPDVLLGVLPDNRRTESEITLDRGATVLLYTDGLVESRLRTLRDGMVELRDTLVELAAQDLDLDTLCDEVIARLLPGHSDDDVALVAVRLHRQDRPRPPEAGPNRIPPDVPDTPPVVPQPG